MPVESILIGLLIAGLRTFELTIDTMRITCIVQRRRRYAAMLGFTQASTFILAAGIVFAGDLDPARIIGYGSGFALGQIVGITIVERLRVGTVTVRIFSPMGPIGVADTLRQAGFAVTTFDGEGRDGPIRMILAVIQKRELDRLMQTVEPYRDWCYVTIGDNPLAPRLDPMPQHPIHGPEPVPA